MTRVAIFMEGGGSGERRVLLRKGMDAFLRAVRAAARAKALKWRVTACGPRNNAYRQFRRAAEERPGDILFLLVDSEEGVKGSPRLHLATRDAWDGLEHFREDQIQLMVQTMETWIIGDPATLHAYYGREFNANALPKRENLEQVPKRVVSSGLARATERTQKGECHKIRHASVLLALIDSEKVRARCPHCERFFDSLASAIEAA